MSILTLFLHASLVVQCVVFLLLLASLWSWSLFLGKLAYLRRVVALDRPFVKDYKSQAHSLQTLFDRGKMARSVGPLQSIFLTAMEALSGFSTTRARPSLHQIEHVMEAHLDVGLVQIRRGLPHLATLASVAPFIGLFGTVWGIMSSFYAIGRASQVTLAIVAPGVAEALFATAFGLFVAIPAVIFYNTLSSRVYEMQNGAEAFIQDLLHTMVVRGGQDDSREPRQDVKVDYPLSEDNSAVAAEVGRAEK